MKRPFHEIRAGLLLSVVIGVVSYILKLLTQSPVTDPLLVALLLGIVCRLFIGSHDKIQPGLRMAPAVFIPFGIIFYGAHNLNFAKLAEINKNNILLLFSVMLVYVAVIFVLGKLLGQKKKITCLTAAGSAICGASAIAVTSPAVEAEPDDISISLLSVALSAFVGFSIILPFLSSLFDLSCRTFCLLSGSVLQFTGLVKVSHSFIPFLAKDMHSADMETLALSVKAVRYLALLILIPLFASLVKKKLYVPWFLWAFLAAGIIGTWVYVTRTSFFNASITHFVKPVHAISWSIALAAIGLNAEIKGLLSNNGTKAIIMAFGGFLAATVTFFIGTHVIRSF